MSNIVERLRQRALSRVGGVKMNGPHLRTDGWQAADTIERLRAALREIRREARTVGYDYGNDKIVSIVDTALAETDPAIPSRPRDGGADIEAAAEEPESDPNYQRDIDQLGALGI